MLRLAENTKIYVSAKAVDFRKAINGLTILVTEQFESPVSDGSVYIFYNRNADRVKCLFWDKNGFVLYQKRLERGKFKFHKSKSGDYTISQQQLDWLLAGLDFRLMSEFPMLNFSQYF
jgi:transposase